MSGINQEINELVQADVDGTISADDRERLNHLLESDETAQRFHQDCLRMAEAMDELESLPAPAGIAEATMARIATLTEEPPVAQNAWLAQIASVFQIPLFRYALAFLVGALFAGGMSQMREPQQRDMAIAGLAGTMSSMSEFVNRQSFSIEQTMTLGQVEMRRAGQLLQLHFELSTEEPVDLVMSYDREQAEFSGFVQSADPAESLDMQAGRVVLKTQGKQQFIVEFSALTETEATVQVSFDSNGESLDTLTVGPSEGGPN